MEVVSSDYVGLVFWSRTGSAEALKRRYISSHVASKCLHKTSLSSREGRYFRLGRVRVVPVEDPLLPGIVRGFVPEHGEPRKTNDYGNFLSPYFWSF